MTDAAAPTTAATAASTAASPATLSLIRPDDWHLHVRDGVALQAVLAHSAAQFGRAMIMPNLNPPVRTLADASAYRERILAALPPGSNFEPLMTLYLTDQTAPDEIVRAKPAASCTVWARPFWPAPPPIRPLA